MKAGTAICLLCLATLAATEPGRGQSSATPVAVTGRAQPADAWAYLNGTVDPGGLETQAWFEWGPTPALGSSTQPLSVGAGSQQLVTDLIVNLESFTTYYFRVIASNSAGTGVGETVSFGTLDTVPPPYPPRPACHVPNVVGRKLAVAAKRITRAGCRVGKRTRFVLSRRSKGIVLSQSPKGGTVLRPQAPVRLTVSRGRPT